MYPFPCSERDLESKIWSLLLKVGWCIDTVEQPWKRGEIYEDLMEARFPAPIFCYQVNVDRNILAWVETHHYRTTLLLRSTLPESCLHLLG